MMDIGVLIIAMIVLLPMIAIIWIATLARSYRRRSEELSDRIDYLQREIEIVRRTISKLQASQETQQPPIREAQPVSPPPTAPSADAVPTPPPSPPARPRPVPPPFPTNIPPIIQQTPEPAGGASFSASAADSPPPPPIPPISTGTAINWERFMAVNLFAWIGGFVLFLAAAFFVKYSIDNNLISPQLRVALGFLLAIGLLVTGLRLSLKDYRVTAQTLCSTGILILYVDVFASHAFYHFIGVPAAFLLMILITTVAFLLAVRLDARVVAILGLLGGFLTPPLLSTGEDNPLGLFSYIFILDAGLIGIALRKKWRFLVLLGAAGTMLMQIGWASEFFTVQKVWTAWIIFAVFEVLFVLALLIARRLEQIDHWISASALSISFLVICFAFYLLGFSKLGERPGTVFSFCLLAEVGLMTAVLVRPSLHLAHRIAGILVFFLLAIWTLGFLREPLLNWALGLSLAFAIAHSAFPLILQRMDPEAGGSSWVHLFPALSMLLILIPIFKLTEVSLAVWFVILFVDLLAVCLAILTASVLSLIGVLLLTLFAMAAWIARVPVSSFELSEGLSLIAGFAIFFFAAGIYAGRKILEGNLKSVSSPDTTAEHPSQIPTDQLAHIPALSSVLPFMLLMLVVIRIPLKDPSPVFAVALLLVFLILGIWRWLQMDLLTVVALLCCLALEYTWYSFHFDPLQPALMILLWYLLFFGIFAALPFLFRTQLQNRVIPWAVSALSGPLHFYLFYKIVDSAYQNPYMGILPAAFSIPPLVSLMLRIRSLPSDEVTRNSQLAYFGGAALFFITLIFPIQFEREWITIGWALEGAALLWLFHRIPHPGLRWLGCILLGIAFVRLTMNPAVLHYYERSTTPILNWYLYTYGIVTACLFIGGRLEGRVTDSSMRPLLYTLGTILGFLLLNIEIADYFSKGKTLSFQFSGNFARDMTYSIAWALFAFIMLIVGINRKLKPPRYAAIGLIGITLLKLFFHDLSNLKHLYRVGALVAVAIVLILASYLYQRFVSFDSRHTSSET